MLDRTLTLALITAIIVCPVWCDVGVCRTDSSSRNHRLTPVEQELAESAVTAVGCDRTPCCQGRKLRTQSRSTAPKEADPPSPCPGKTCQGVCGGAVVGEPVPRDCPHQAWVLPLDADHATTALNGGDSNLTRQPPSRQFAAPNYGRMLRTLRMSFLC